ncbi:MAG: uracil-DNA glycosylase [Phycisphaerae bacterium]|nr:uracil-DNA glycosylase [Phycisphaerae bacterium]
MASLADIVRQDAMTSRLLGVDFVPLAPRRPSADRVDAAPPAPAATDAPSVSEIKPAPAVTEAERARRAALLEEVRQRYLRDEPHRHFVTDHHTIVFGEGDPAARLMFIGEAPGAEEDKVGRPFVGRSGELLEKMIRAMGLRREQVYICNVLKTRPPNNATPTIDEASRCAPYLFDQIAAVLPEVIVTLGLPASRVVLATDSTMSAMRGRWFTWRHPDALRFPDLLIPVMPTFHPAFVLRQYTEETRGKVWSDLRQVMQRLGLEAARSAQS